MRFVAYGVSGDAATTDLLLAVVHEFAEHALDAAALAPVQTGAALIAALQEHPTGRLVVLYDRAEHAVLKALNSATPPLAALADWQESARELLTCYRKHRRRILLVEATEFRNMPQQFVTKLAGHLTFTPPEDMRLAAPTAAVDGLRQVIAVQTVLQSAAAIKLNGELAAGALPLAGPGAGQNCDVNQAFQEYLEQVDRAAGLQAVQELAEQQGAVIAQEKTAQEVLAFQLSSAQEELESTWRTAETLRGERDALSGQLEALQKKAAQADELVALQGRYDAATQELHQQNIRAEQFQNQKDLLQMQLETVQKEMETYYLEATSLKAKHSDMEKRLGDLSGRLVTASSQSDDLALQLKQTQEALEKTRVDLDEKTRELEESLHHSGQLQEQLHQRQEDLQRVLESNAWKVTGPLRHAKDSLMNRGKRGK